MPIVGSPPGRRLLSRQRRCCRAVAPPTPRLLSAIFRRAGAHASSRTPPPYAAAASLAIRLPRRTAVVQQSRAVAHVRAPGASAAFLRRRQFLHTPAKRQRHKKRCRPSTRLHLPDTARFSNAISLFPSSRPCALFPPAMPHAARTPCCRVLPHVTRSASLSPWLCIRQCRHMSDG